MRIASPENVVSGSLTPLAAIRSRFMNDFF
jgi:hypothetical protein